VAGLIRVLCGLPGLIKSDLPVSQFPPFNKRSI